MAYEFALNPIKLQRAIRLAKSDEEDAVMDAYIKLGGKVVDLPKKVVKEPKNEPKQNQPKKEQLDPAKLEELKEKGWKL